MKYNYTLGMQNLSVQEKIKTKQFELSEELLDKRFELSLNIQEMADIIGITIEDYAKLEFGDSNLKINRYQLALIKIDEYIKDLNKNIVISVNEKGSNANKKSTNFYNYNNKINYLYNQKANTSRDSSISQAAEAA